MDPKTVSKQKGIRMAMQIAALSLGAGAAVMALSASEAKADGAKSADPQPGAEVQDGTSTEPMKVTGWSCWGPISRGPLAPPSQSDADFDALLAEVPWS